MMLMAVFICFCSAGSAVSVLAMIVLVKISVDCNGFILEKLYLVTIITRWWHSGNRNISIYAGQIEQFCGTNCRIVSEKATVFVSSYAYGLHCNKKFLLTICVHSANNNMSLSVMRLLQPLT